MRYKFTFFAAAIILSGFWGIQTAFAQTTQQPVRKIDRKKMNQNCTGNFLAGVPNANGNIPQDVENLGKIYDFGIVKATALKNRFKITDERMFVPVRSMMIEEFNRDYNSGAPYKAGDAPREVGALRLVAEGSSYVELQGRVLEIEKRIAADEKWTLRLNYVVEGRDDFPQEINVSQTGRCNLSDDYIRARAKLLLDSLGIESDWTSRASVMISTIN